MGCLQVGKSYFDFNNVEERDLRKWEKDIGSFSLDFNHFQQRFIIGSKSIHSTIVRRVVEATFSREFYRMIQENSFFKVEQEGNSQDYLDINKILALTFLLTAPGLKCSSHCDKFFDKALYIYSKSKSNEEEDMSLAMTKNENLKEFVRTLVLTASEGEATSFFKIKSLDEKGIINKVAENVDKIVDFIIEDLFTGSKKERLESLSFSELNLRFSVDPFFFSGGYFREKAITCISGDNTNNGNETKQ